MRTRSLNLGLVRRAFDKLVVGPIKYRSSDGYDARRYWDDRLSSYGMSLQGVGHEGLSETDNAEMYAEAGAIFRSLVRPLIGNDSPRTLEVGCGVGFYTGQLHDLGVVDYTGLDITDALFGELHERFPTYDFVQGDITGSAVDGQYQLVLMIDVAEHIVTADRLSRAIENLKNATVPGGHVIIGPQFESGARHLFYVHFWSVDEVAVQFADWSPVFRQDYRGGKLLCFRKPAE
jgi:SAM-dependent methyltransferase